MPETSNSQDNTNKKSEVDFKRFIEISKWTIKMLFSIDKRLTIINIVMDIVKRFDSIVNTYIVAMMFDSVIKSIEGG